MAHNHAYDGFRNEVQPALKSKVEEFSLLGYGKLTEQELWDFLTKKKWKKINDHIRLFEIVDEILSVKPGEYMNYATVEAFKSPDFSMESEEDRKGLFK